MNTHKNNKDDFVFMTSQEWRHKWRHVRHAASYNPLIFVVEDDTPTVLREKSAMERFLDETSNVTLLKLRVFGGNQELIVNRYCTHTYTHTQTTCVRW